jgi:hypothetical protein
VQVGKTNFLEPSDRVEALEVGEGERLRSYSSIYGKDRYSQGKEVWAAEDYLRDEEGDCRFQTHS